MRSACAVTDSTAHFPPHDLRKYFEVIEFVTNLKAVESLCWLGGGHEFRYLELNNIWILRFRFKSLVKPCYCKSRALKHTDSVTHTAQG